MSSGRWRPICLGLNVLTLWLINWTVQPIVASSPEREQCEGETGSMCKELFRSFIDEQEQMNNEQDKSNTFDRTALHINH